MTTNVLSLARVLTVAAAIFPAVCDAQDGFPTRPVRFVVPFPAATPPDFLARIASQKLAESWGVPVIVEVRDGAGGTIGVNQVVRAIPDGYTLLFTNDLSIAIAPVLSKTPYDPRKDLSPIGAVAQGTSVLVMHPSAGVSSIKELIAMAKARPGALTFASAGDASTSRMCVELIKQAAGVDLVQVPYRGAAPAIQAVLAGEVSMYCSPAFQALPHLKSGKLKALGVTGTRPSPVIPEVMPISEQGLPEVIVSTWYAAFAPSGTPPAVLDKIRDALKKVFDDAGVRQKLAGAGLDPIWMDATELAAKIRSDLEKWTRLAKATGITTE
ncbi:MAG: tripartite tricarboxylate transporter substrate binding protein [Betaproteobacteria bacterium]|nr:MAG: tripartite tricarboxylate transporter substrate binding protein [Betaproteobacteria bacterium]